MIQHLKDSNVTPIDDDFACDSGSAYLHTRVYGQWFHAWLFCDGAAPVERPARQNIRTF